MTKHIERKKMETTRNRWLVGTLALLCLGFVMVAGSSTAEAVQRGRRGRLELNFKVGQPFPNLRLPSLKDGNPASLSDFRGQKVILHIFASW